MKTRTYFVARFEFLKCTHVSWRNINTFRYVLNFKYFSGEIVKAFELSDTVVPAELREFWDNYKKKQAEEGKTVKSGGGGFGGSGFKFDESEALYTSEKKKFQKTVFGLQDSDDEDVEGEIDDQIEVKKEFFNPMFLFR